MEFTLTFSMDNEMFDKDPKSAAIVCLLQVCSNVSRRDSDEGDIVDFNGSLIGNWEIMED